MKTLEQFTAEWNAINLMKLFEIPVTNKLTNEGDFLTFDISIRGNSFIAQHNSLTEAQVNSDKIAFVSVEIDLDFSIDHHLNELYEACTTAIMESEFF